MKDGRQDERQMRFNRFGRAGHTRVRDRRRVGGEHGRHSNREAGAKADVAAINRFRAPLLLVSVSGS